LTARAVAGGAAFPEPLQLPFTNAVGRPGEVRRSGGALPPPPPLAGCERHRGERALALFVAYLARLTRERSFLVGFGARRGLAVEGVEGLSFADLVGAVGELLAGRGLVGASGPWSVAVEWRGGALTDGAPAAVLAAVIDGDTGDGSWEYDPVALAGAVAERIGRQLSCLAAALAADPALPPAAAPLLGCDERRQLECWGRGEPLGPPAVTLDRLFEARAASRPTAVAVLQGDREVTYGELDRRAERLAARLRGLGVGRGALVGVAMERIVDLPAALLAVLKCGAAYVPLDPAYPAERLAFMLEDTAAAVVITQRRLAGGLPPGAPRPLLVDDGDGEEVPPPPSRRRRPDPADLAYVIYTSGSTGRPKGVAIEHRSAVALLAWAGERFPPRRLDGMLASTSINFDLSVFELFLPLANGGRVVLAANALELAGMAHRDEVTFLNTVPSAMKELLRLGAVPLSVATVALAGEPLSRELAEAIYALGSVDELYDLYGPSEDTTYSTWSLVPRRLTGAPAIGRPIAGTQAWPVDRRGELTPIGVPGELLLGGAGLARGYLRRPALTAGRFVPDPFGGAPGGRLYRTGDLVRWRAAGELDFLGRIDTQVKVRGFRIELGEIESELRRQAGVGEAVALVHGDDDPRLVAFVVGAGAAPPPAAELRAHLARRLPAYMVPSLFVPLNELPLTPNRKIDRRALARSPLPTTPAAAGSAAYVAPRTAVERELAERLAALLAIDRVGVEDDFYQLGAHSLQLTRLTAEAAARFGVELDLQAVFAAPTVAGLAAAVEAASGPGAAPPLVAMPRSGPVPLSHDQESLWLTTWFERTPAFNVPLAMAVEGPLAAAALAAALTAVGARHEALRTVLPTVGEAPAQVVLPATPVQLPVVDLRALTAGDRSAAARRLAAVEARRVFDLAAGPLLRAALLRLGHRRHSLLVTMHHTVADGWSEEILLRDLAALYRRATGLSPAPSLPELPIQYADFALWQRRWITAERLAPSLAYWHRHVGDDPWSFSLPADRPRPRVRSLAGETLALALPAPLVERLTGLGRERGASLFMTLLAVFGSLLAHHTGERHFLVGAPVAGRGRPQLSDLVGLFVNTLLLRTVSAGDPPFAELLARVRRTAVEGFAHQDVPLALLGKHLGGRDRLPGELFRILFNVQQSFRLAGELAPGVSWRGREVPTGTAKVELAVVVEQGDDGLEALFEYSTELFDRSTIARLARHYRTLLAEVAAAPERRLSELRLLSASERHQLAEWSDGRRLEPPPEGLAALVATQARRTAERVAVTHGAEALSYGELVYRARLLAARLRAQGAAPEARVAVCVDRSPRMVVALLAVLAAGAAYVPLDPEHPPRRLAAVLAEARPVALVAERRLASRCGQNGAGAGVSVVVLDDDTGAAGGGAAEGPAALARAAEPRVGGDHAAYLLFTSGSTGRPKGVTICHRGVVSLFAELARRPGLGEEDVWLAVTTYAFDISVLELFLPLAVGARTVLVDRWDAADGRRLAAALERARATVLQATPATWRLLLDGGWAGETGLTALSGGEALLPDLAQRLLARVGSLWNLYGPTETTIYSTGGEIAAGEPITIGWPLANTRVQVLDRRGREVAPGVPGQLWIGGGGLARGYFGRPGRTAQSFRPDPTGTAGARLYASGDLARWRPDGRLELLGRLDAQLKVRGFRIEPGELEAALLELPQVGRAVVAAREVGPGDRRLVAYLVAAGGDGGAVPPAAELRRHLAARVPDFMVPAAFVTLEALPLTPSGKVDRGALPAPVALEDPRALWAPPRDQLEEAVAGFFTDLLRLPRVGIHDDFFTLGGHSLLLTQLLSRLLRTFDVELSFRQLILGGATVAGIAEHLRQAGRREALPPIEPVPRDEAPPLSFSQLRQWFLVQLDPASGDYNIPFAIELGGALAPRLLARGVAAIVARHEVLRTSFAAHGGRPRLEIAAAVRCPLPAVDLTALPVAARAAEAQRLAEADAWKPFDLRRAPLLRAALVRLGADQHLMLVNVHHIVADGWSLGIFLRELAALYEALAQGRRPALAPLPVQYADYAAWHRRWLQGPVLERLLGYWRRQLAGAEPQLALPTDRRRPAQRSLRGGRVPVRLEAELATAVRQGAARAGATAFMLLLAAFEALLIRVTGQRDLSVGTYVANRHRYETEGLIGFFINTLVLRTTLGERVSFADLLARVRDVTLGAYDHQDLPFERLLEELEVERHLDRTPLFQVMFALQNFLPAAPAPGALAITPLVLAPSRRANFDLTLWMWEAEGRFDGAFEYRRDLFDRTTIERLRRHLETLLAAAVTAPQTALEALPLLSAGERHQLTCEWREPQPAAGSAPPAGDEIAARAQRQPDAVAVTYEDEHLCYGELLRRARGLARRLRHAGVRPESRVAVSLRRGPRRVVALLAVLEAGGAYLPLSPDDPPARRAALLADAGALLLTEPEGGAVPEAFAGPAVSFGEEDRPAMSAAAPAPGWLAVEALAYVIYTSGSTGSPKGVLVGRPALDRFVTTAARLYDVRAGDRVLQFASLAFDTSVEEIFPTLAAGATLVLRSDRMIESPATFVACCHRWRLTHLDLPTAYWHQLADHLATSGTALPSSLRLVIIAGEQALAERLDQWHLAVGDTPQLINTYGPTEATVAATACDLAAPPLAPHAGVAIGSPIAGVAAEVCDRSGRLLPIGVGGELWLGGASLARGYLGRPGLTAQRFVPAPGLAAGGRWYRTGDRARRLAAGALEMLGRFDHQVKVRGFRVELGEIEAVLSGHPGVAEAVVEAVEVAPGDRRLVALFVPADAHRPPAEEELRTWLRRDLPAYMLPAALVPREALPRTVSGKVDRRRLAAADELAAARREPVAAPATPTEEAMVEIWQDLLARHPIGAGDDFFSLGGHSLLVPQLLARIEGRFGVALPVRVLFEAPRLSELALIVEERLLAEIEALSDEEVERLAGGEDAPW
jgi:amino acid adenylation domain-containing protein